MKAINHYNGTTKFITFAYKCVQTEIRNFVKANTKPNIYIEEQIHHDKHIHLILEELLYHLEEDERNLIKTIYGIHTQQIKPTQLAKMYNVSYQTIYNKQNAIIDKLKRLYMPKSTDKVLV